jgi:hypothetical protein
MHREDLSEGRRFRLSGRRGHIDLPAGATTAIQITVGVVRMVRKITGCSQLRIDSVSALSNYRTCVPTLVSPHSSSVARPIKHLRHTRSQLVEKCGAAEGGSPADLREARFWIERQRDSRSEIRVTCGHLSCSFGPMMLHSQVPGRLPQARLYAHSEEQLLRERGARANRGALG